MVQFLGRPECVIPAVQGHDETCDPNRLLAGVKDRSRRSGETPVAARNDRLRLPRHRLAPVAEQWHHSFWPRDKAANHFVKEASDKLDKAGWRPVADCYSSMKYFAGSTQENLSTSGNINALANSNSTFRSANYSWFPSMMPTTVFDKARIRSALNYSKR